jgi:hypothetical protein
MIRKTITSATLAALGSAYDTFLGSVTPAEDIQKAIQPIVDEMAQKYNCSVSVGLLN